MLKGTPGELASGDMSIKMELKKLKKHLVVFLYFIYWRWFTVWWKSDILKSQNGGCECCHFVFGSLCLRCHE